MQRIQHIDILKGIGIFLVVLGHVTTNNDLHKFIYAFHMPLFFIISGLFLHDQTNFIKSKAKSLLIPYISFGLLTFLYWLLIESRFRELPQGETFLSQFINLFFPTGTQYYNIILWFLPCLFLACVAGNYLNCKITSKVKIQIIIIVLICSVGFLGNSYPYYIGQAAQALPYVLVGVLISKREGKHHTLIIDGLLSKFKKTSILVAIAGILVIYFSGVTCNMHSSSFTPCYPLSFIVGLLGFISIYILSYCLKKNTILSWLGINSLAIMLMHEPIKRIVIKLYSVFLNTPIEIIREESILNCFVIAILTILILIPFILITNRYCPILLGKFPHKIQS